MGDATKVGIVVDDDVRTKEFVVRRNARIIELRTTQRIQPTEKQM